MNALRRISDPGPDPERKQFSADLQAQRMSELIRVNRDVGISVRASRNLNPSVALRTDGIFIAAHERTRLDQREVALTAGLLPFLQQNRRKADVRVMFDLEWRRGWRNKAERAIAP